MILNKRNDSSIEQTINILNSNKIVIIPTDTIYGFSGLVPNTNKIIRRIKGRDEAKPFIQLIASPKSIFSLTKSVIPKTLLDLWPGALTLIVRDLNGVTTTAYRCPDDGWLRAVLTECKTPLYSTSVNRSGFSVLDTIQEIKAEFKNEIELIIDDGDKKNMLPSTIVDISGSELKILRQGSVRLN